MRITTQNTFTIGGVLLALIAAPIWLLRAILGVGVRITEGLAHGLYRLIVGVIGLTVAGMVLYNVGHMLLLPLFR